MSEEHEHKPRIRYTVWMDGRLFVTRKYVLVGVGSSQRDGELLIHQEDGTLHCFNFRRVQRMQAEIMTDDRQP